MTRVVRIAQVLEAVGVSRATLWRMVKAERFPAPIQIGPRAVGWYEREVKDWLDSRPRATSAP